MSTNYLTETDKLDEAGKILRGETRMLPTDEHLKALRQLVRQAYFVIAALNEQIKVADPYRLSDRAKKLAGTDAGAVVKRSSSDPPRSDAPAAEEARDPENRNPRQSRVATNRSGWQIDLPDWLREAEKVVKP